MSRVRMLKHFGITPYLVFDGDYLPSKSKTEKERSARRKESRAQGLRLLELGKSAQAHQELQKAVDVTPEMAGQLIEELKRNEFQYVVAPYEADSQLVYLEREGIIDGILSEDSDLLVFGAKKLLTKLDQYGECIMIRRDEFTACKEVSLVGWTDHDFRRMAIMSGCDYLASIEKMGLKTAYRLIRKHKSMDKIIRAVQFDGKFKVPANYLDTFTQAERTFLYQWIFCPKAKAVVNFSSLEDGVSLDDLPFIGKHVEASIAQGVARGALHPHTKEPLQVRTAPTARRYGHSQNSRNASSIAKTPDLKGHKPINSFFQPKRTPLAELDPNVFQGSPEQQALARRASGTSWPATPIPQPVQMRRSLTTPMLPATAPAISRRTVSHNAPHLTASDRAPKRQRLCTEGSSPVVAKGSAKAEYGASKFFGGSAAAASPSKRTKGGKRKSDDFDLWSDASIEEAMLELPEPNSHSVKPLKVRKRLAVFDDVVPTTVYNKAELQAAEQSDSQQTITSVSTAVFSQGRKYSATPRSSIDQSQGKEKREESLFDDTLCSEVHNLRERFSYTRGPLGTSAKAMLSRTCSAPVVSTSSKASAAMQGLPQGLKDGLFSVYKPAASSSRELQSTARKSDFEHNEPEPEVEIEDSAWHEADSVIVVPASDDVEPPTTPPREHKSPAAGIVLAGSEDLLVSESELDSEDNQTPKKKPCVNFGRFAFVPT
ncbi:exonuclease-like protein [Venturia nashicola]|nr:exonuclease-like protein [Venturia nashicola]